MLFLAIPAVIWVVAHDSFSANMTADDIAGEIRVLGGWAIAASLALMILCALSPLPSELVAIANGMVYGPIAGFALTWSSGLIGAMVAFALARLLGRPAITVVLSPDNNKKFDELMYKRGASILLIGRTIPLAPYFLLNFAFGLSPMRWWTYIWVSALGMIPMTIVVVLFGNQLGVMLF